MNESRPNSSGATRRAIAQATGLSVATVGHILGNRGHLYSAQAREKVMQAAQELGYRPNSSAKAMQSGRFGCAAVLLKMEANNHLPPPLLLQGICDALTANDLHLSIARIPDEKLSHSGYVPKILREVMADGLLIDYIQSVPQAMIDLIRQYNIPSIWLNNKMEADCVYPDDLHAGRWATERLLQLGHRRIAYAHFFDSTHYSAADRRSGYQQVMREAGYPEQLVLRPGGDNHADWQECFPFAKAFLSAADRPTAIIAYDRVETEAMLGAAMALGLHVPRDLSIVQFHDQSECVLGTYPTTFLIPQRELARVAVDELMRKIETPARVFPGMAVRFGLEEGRSWGPPAP